MTQQDEKFLALLKRLLSAPTSEAFVDALRAVAEVAGGGAWSRGPLTPDESDFVPQELRARSPGALSVVEGQRALLPRQAPDPASKSDGDEQDGRIEF